MNELVEMRAKLATMLEIVELRQAFPDSLDQDAYMVPFLDGKQCGIEQTIEMLDEMIESRDAELSTQAA